MGHLNDTNTTRNSMLLLSKGFGSPRLPDKVNLSGSLHPQEAVIEDLFKQATQDKSGKNDAIRLPNLDELVQAFSKLPPSASPHL